MTIDTSDNGDGITFERRNGTGDGPAARLLSSQVRAVVMRHGQRVTSKWRRTKDAALRNLVVELTRQLDTIQNTDYDWETGEVFQVPDDLRLNIADGLEALAMVEFKNGNSSTAEMFHVNGKEHIVNKIDRLFRGAHTLRWVQKREDAR